MIIKVYEKNNDIPESRVVSSIDYSGRIFIDQEQVSLLDIGCIIELTDKIYVSIE